MFGEYIPLVQWLPMVEYLTPITGSYQPGNRPVTFELENLHANAAPLICFEDTFPGVARASAGDNVDFLVNLTNDGWFGDSAPMAAHGQCRLSGGGKQPAARSLCQQRYHVLV